MAENMDTVESMDEDFTGFDEEEAIVAPSGAILDLPSKLDQAEHSFNETQDTDSDSGNLVIAEPQKKQETKVSEKSPRKRKPKVEDTTPTRARSSRALKGQGLAYLIAMEKGGSKKQMAKAQAQVDAQDASIAAAISSTELLPQVATPMYTEPVKEIEFENKKTFVKDTTKSTKEMVKATKEKDPIKQLKERDVRRETSKSPLPTIANVPSPQVSTSKPATKSSSSNRKSFAAVNISSPLLKEPFKEGWKREVVYRATVDPGNKTLCDVYYYTPDGKKLRSGREVSDYLEKSGSPFSGENFTFFKEPIGMDDNVEILRYAKTRREEAGGEKQTMTKKDKALKAREEELRRNLQELGEDVAAIKASNSPVTEGTASSTATAEPQGEESSPQQRKKRGAKVEKQLKIKLWGKGLRSKENAEPSLKKEKEDTTEGEDDVGSTIAVINKVSPARTVPDDISHLFTPCSAPATVTVAAQRSTTRGHKSTSHNAAVAFGTEAAQHLEVINGKRFISIGPGQESGDSASNKRPPPSPRLGSPRSNAKKIKLAISPSHPANDLPTRGRLEGYGSFLSSQLNNFVSNAYHGLLHVFRFLTVQELMAAAGVCKLWRDLALHQSHWRLVRLKNSRIYDWSLFSSHLRRAGTQHLDLRKMFFVASPEETWVNLMANASNLSEILRIELCKCPSEVLESIIQNCMRLQHIDAQSISSSSIRLELLNRLNDLEELKIRSVSGLALEHGLQVFSHLHKLKTLNLTTLTNLPSSELTHLENLTQLESLEIGHCVSWSSAADYEMLSKLQHLRHLRIEQGPSVGILQYLEASLSGLCHLQHLEIVNFTVDTQIQEFKLTNLKRLLMIPKYSNETLDTTIQNVFDCVSSMTHLQQLSWIVTDEIMQFCVNGKLPLSHNGENQIAEVENTEGFTLDELQELLSQRLPQTNCTLMRLPEFATYRYSLSVDQED